MQIKWFKLNLVVALIIVGLSVSPSYSATADMKIGTVDMQKALQTVNAGKKARGRLEKEFNQKKDSLKKEEASIKKMHEEFQKQSLVMSDKARVKKQQELQERIMKLQEQTARSQMEIQKKEQDLTRPLIEQLRGVIQNLASDKGYNMVLEKGTSVLFSSEKDDLTEEVIKKFNEKHKG